MDSDFVTGSSTQNKTLFDQNALDAAEETADGSLQLLSNCVYLVNSTILRERKLIPAELFREFRVYDDVTGYIIKDETRNGVKIATKLRATEKAITSKMIHKLAIVVEEPINSKPVETFIWTFAYNSSTSAVAEIGYENRKSKFVVDYNDIDGTCQQFCKIFSDLQRVLKELQLLPKGMVPTVKIAFRGEPDSIEGFHHVDEFVDPKEIDRECSIGSVPFPFDNKFKLSYASKFTSLRSNRQAPVVHQNIAILDPMDSSSDPLIEVARRDTMNYEDFQMDMDPVAAEEEPMESDLIDASINCNANVASNIEKHAVLQSEFRGSTDADSVHEKTESSSPKSPVRKQSQTIIPKNSNSARKTEKISRNKNKKEFLKNTKKMSVPEESVIGSSENAPEKKRSARRLTLLVTDGDERLAESAKAVERESTDTEPMDVDEVPAEEHHDLQSRKKYGRVKSLVEIVQNINEDPVSISGKNDDEHSNSQKAAVKRYGCTASFKRRDESGIRGDDDLDDKNDDEDEDQKKDEEGEDQKKDDEDEDQKKDDEEEAQKEDDVDENQKKDDEELDDQKKDDEIMDDHEEDAHEPVVACVKKYGRVSSVRGITEKTTEVRRVSTRRAGRVSSILNLVDQPRQQKEDSSLPNYVDDADVVVGGIIADEKRVVEISLEEETKPSNRYGRVSSVMADVEQPSPSNKSNEMQQSKKYGQSTSLRSKI